MEGSSHKPHSFGKTRLLLTFGVFTIFPVLAMNLECLHVSEAADPILPTDTHHPPLEIAFVPHTESEPVTDDVEWNYGDYQANFSPRSHYEEMNCIPLPNKNNVKSYKCAFESLRPGDKRCIYRGALLNDGQSIPNVECNVGCFCITRSSEFNGDFLCAVVDCSEFFIPKNQSCIYQYGLNDCCSSKQVCGDTAISKLFKCVVDGKTYREGEVFYPENSCKKCVCQKGFRGRYVQPFCKTIDCGVERENYKQILSRCAPVYLEGRPCCPIDWQCYKSTDRVVKTGRPSSTTVPYRCSYGQLKLYIGEMVVTSNKCRICSCDYPPLVTCKQKKNCVP